MLGAEIVLPDQLWIDSSGSGQTPQETAEIPVFDDEHGLPAGGLWTSTHNDRSCEYVRRILLVLDGFMALTARPASLLTPEVARVFEVEDRSAEDAVRAIAPESPFWPCVARHLDAVHMTGRGAFGYTPALSDLPTSERVANVAGRLDAGRGPPDYWEAERTIWFRWCFSEARRVADVHVPLLA